MAEQPPALPGTLSRPDAQRIIDALNLRLYTQEQAVAKGVVPGLATTGTQRKIAFGSTSVTFSASKFSGEVEVTHGLGTTPLHIYVTSENAEITAGTRGYTSTQFTLQAGDWLEAITGTRTIHWLAIG